LLKRAVKLVCFILRKKKKRNLDRLWREQADMDVNRSRGRVESLGLEASSEGV